MEKYEKNPTKPPTDSLPAPSHRSSTSSLDLSPFSDKSTHRTIENPNTTTTNNNDNDSNIIISNNNNNNKPSINTQSPNRKSSSSSSELSPLSSLGHGSPPHDSPAKASVVNRNIREQPPPVWRVDPVVNGNIREEPPAPRRVDQGGGGRRVRQPLSILRAVKRKTAVKRAALGFRICGVVFCLISLSVMAADQNSGWALDSFYRYNEFRYCISVNVVGFLYSLAQTCNLAFTICTGKYVLRHQYRFHFNFTMDQILTYLLMSASSSAATRVNDWESNWGKDKFPRMASVSVGLSFMSFIALAASTLISGYALCTWLSS